MRSINKIVPNPSIRSILVDFIDNTKVIQQSGLKTAIIDADSLIFAVCVDKKQSDEQVEQYGLQSERTLETVIEEFNNYFLNVLTSTGCIQYCALLTSGSHRYSFYPEYKANRKKLEKPKFLKELREYAISTLGFLAVDGYEADDLVNICSQVLGPNQVLVHTDKDLDQIPGEHFNYKKLDKTTGKYITELYSISQHQAAINLWTQVITGDVTDNIKGIPGKGKVFTDKLVVKSGLSGESLRGLILEAYIEKFGEYQGIEEFTLNYKLIKLLDATTDWVFPVVNIEDKLDLNANLNI